MADDITQWLITLKSEELDELLGPQPSEIQQPEIFEAEIDSFIASHRKENTVKKTQRDVKKCIDWLKNNTGEIRQLEEIPPSELSILLGKFFIAIRKTDGEEYEPLTLATMKSSLERYLRDHQYPVSLNDRQFHKLNQALRAKQIDLKQQGKGRKERKADAISIEEEEKLWNEGILGIHDPESANFTMFYLFGKHFGLRGRDEHRQLRYGDIVVLQDSDGAEYIEFHERQTKTRDGTGHDTRQFSPKIYATTENPVRNPVNLYNEYVKHRPAEFCTPESPFYLQPLPPRYINSNVWFYKSPLGKNQLGKIMQTAASKANLQGRKTNHSVRKTCVRRLSAAGVPPHKIIKITGHKNTGSLQHYDEIEPTEQRELSHILSHSTKQTNNIDVNASSSNNNPMFDNIVGKSNQLFAAGAVLNNCVFNINHITCGHSGESNNSKQHVDSGNFRRIRVIESDSSDGD